MSIDWVGVVAGIREGDAGAASLLANIFEGGIRFFLARVLGQHKLQYRQREVLSLVIRSIRTGSIDNPNRLASHVLTILNEYIRSQTAVGVHLAIQNEKRANKKDIAVILELLAKIEAVDREALRRYYVEGATSEQVCQVLHLPSARFHRLKSTLRSAVRRGRASPHESERL